MKKYLLDTNICVYYLKGKYELDLKINEIGVQNCHISIITQAELQFGVENSAETRKAQNQIVLNNFCQTIQIIPIEPCVQLFAHTKAVLRQVGTPVDNFDLLIGCTALAHNFTLVTRNVKHFDKITGLMIENWVMDE
jgi:tRNA(fMet)-specific endonuclease VapC